MNLRSFGWEPATTHPFMGAREKVLVTAGELAYRRQTGEVAIGLPLPGFCWKFLSSRPKGELEARKNGIHSIVSMHVP